MVSPRTRNIQIEGGEQCSGPFGIPLGEALAELSMFIRQIQINQCHTHLSARLHTDVRTDRTIRADSVRTAPFTAVFVNRSA